MQLQQTQRRSFQKLGRSSTAQLKGQAQHHVHDGMKKCGTRTNETEETHDTAEDLYDEDLHKQVGVGSVREGGRGACDTHRDTTEKVARADGQTSPEERVPCEHN